VVFLHNAVVIVALILLLGHSLAPVALLALAGVALLTLIGFFAGIALAPLCARYRDVSLVVTNVMQVMFFLTPIHWTIASM
ncbi:MAG: ABC transporter permease, partial [Gammaproteobacteria bacterium]|nr:ABC transporter permease [Gammaproteobacteria bacterium]